MARIAKSDVHAVLRRAADLLIQAGGDDQRISRADAKALVGSLQGLEKLLVDMFFRFIDHRDHRPGATVTVRDVEDAYHYAKDKLIDAYDVNGNGLSRAEVAKMSMLAKLAVALAAERAQQSMEATEQFDSDGVEDELRQLVQGLTLVSECNARFEPVVVPLAPTAQLELDTVRLLFGDIHDELAQAVVDHPREQVFDLDDAWAEQREFQAWFAERRMPDDLLDPLEVERAVRTGELVDFLAAHTLAPQVFAFCDPTAELGDLAGELIGEVSVFIVGRNLEGWIVGVYTTSLES